MAMGLALFGVISPAVATLMNDGSTILASLNAGKQLLR